VGGSSGANGGEEDGIYVLVKNSEGRRPLG
jgi:hypothetical protein